jgi:hypothetical protein
MTNAVTLSVSPYHALALRDDGSVVAWGDPSAGKLNVPPNLGKLTAVAAGNEFSLGLRPDGSVVVWGDQGAESFGLRRLPQDLHDVVQLAAAPSWALALRKDGIVLQWGKYSGGTMEPPPVDLSGVVQISAGPYHALALLSDSTVRGWGEVTTPPGLSNVVAIAAGVSYSVALIDDGSVVEWGGAARTPPPDATNLVAIAAGDSHCLGLRDDGRVISWGVDNTGKAETVVPTNLPPVIAIAAAGDTSYALIAPTPAPHLTRHPRGQDLFTGQLLRLRAVAFAAGAEVAYQWYKDETKLPGATNSEYVVSSADVSDTGNYWAQVSNPFGSETSRRAAVHVTEQAPVLLTQPADADTTADGTVQFSASVIGSEPLLFQWFFAQDLIPGATGPELTVSNVTQQLEGTYRLVAANDIGKVSSRSAVLRIVPAISWASTNVSADAFGQFKLTLALSEPAAEPIHVHIAYSLPFRLPGGTVLDNWRDAFLDLPAGTMERTVTVSDHKLGYALANGFGSVVRLIGADNALVRGTAEFGIQFSATSPDVPACDPGQPMTLLTPGAVRMTPDGTAILTVPRLTSAPIALEFSTDLQSWSGVDTGAVVDQSGSTVWFAIPGAIGQPFAFYRVVCDSAPVSITRTDPGLP